MLTNSSSPTRRSVLAASAAAVVGSALAPEVAKAQLVGTKRTDLSGTISASPDARSSR